jgi:hypothetical protein
LKAHNYPTVFNNVIFKRFAEQSEPGSLEDIYRRDGGLYFDAGKLPPEIRVVSVHPKEYEDWERTKVIPVVCLTGKKIAFELEIDRKATGADVFDDIGWGDRQQIVTKGDIRIRLIVAVEQLPDPKSYTCRFYLDNVESKDAESRFSHVEMRPGGLERH